MRFPLQFVKSIKTKRLLSIIILIFIVLVLLLAYFFLEEKMNNGVIILFLLGISIAQIFILQYFFRNQLKNELKISNLNLRIKELRTSLDEVNKLADHKSIYLENMSYEIRTPLSTILGMLNILKQTNLDADQKAQVEIAEYSSRHLLQLVDMVTSNADLEREDDIELNLLAIDLNSDLSKLFKIFEYQAWEKGLQFEYKFLVDDKRKYFLLGDSMRIQQIMINLINNAIKFTNTGKISIIVDQTVSIDDEQIVSFYIKDTGIGLRADEIKKVFYDPKLYNSRILKDYRGGGLGLSISHKLVKLMGGELKLESKENEGSTFYFTLQFKKTLNVETEVENEKPILSEKFSVLVAEDNRMNQKVIKFLLEQQGADCTFAKNGLEAVELYKILDFDMIFMDIYMPDMDGYQATKAIKETAKYSELKTPIIAVSASAFDVDIVNAKLAGIDDFLAKPIEVTKLKELLITYSN
ncbi:ATP-binding protein [Mariniflexile sp.]|uniref:ATP-binding protein n=1 Tax=Mariniflexile sp. TaxID=1979402 RepID=UPI003567B298